MAETFDEISRYLNVYRAHGPSWSSDATQLAFVADLDGLDQAWLIDTTNSKLEQLTHFDDRVGLVAWSPNSQYILVTVDIGGNEHDQLYLVHAINREIRSLTQDFDIIHRFGAWSPDGKYICYSCNRRHRAFFDVWVMDISTGETRCLLEQDATLAPLIWSPGGKTIVVSRENTSLDNDLFIVHLFGGEPQLLTAHSSETIHTDPCFSRDGYTLYVLTNHNREFLAPAAMDLTVENVSNMHVSMHYLVDTVWDAEGRLSISPDGRTLVWALNDNGCSQLIFYDLETDKELSAPLLPPGVIEGLAWAPDGTRVAFSFNGVRHNGNIWTAVPGHDTAHPLTALSMKELDPSTLIVPELLHYTSFDGLEIPAYYYRPTANIRNNANGVPVIIFVHGGPASQFRPLFASPTMPPIQYYLNLGFAVFAPNVRGSRGYGKTFIHLDDAQLRPNSVADLRAGVEWLTTHGGADPYRIGIMGRSYGGFMVLAAITSYPEIWAAAVDISGIANFLTFFKNTGIWRRHLRIPEYGDPDRDAELLRELSPLFKVNRITTPLLVLHGVNDPRVPVSEAEQIVDGVQRRGLPTKLLLFPNEGHFMSHQSTQLVAYSAIKGWFEKYIG